MQSELRHTVSGPVDYNKRLAPPKRPAVIGIAAGGAEDSSCRTRAVCRKMAFAHRPCI
jgi:hypothetical protein